MHGHLILNLPGLLGAAYGFGTAGLVTWLCDQAGASQSVALLVALHAGALVAGLFAAAYDRHSGLDLFESYCRYILLKTTGEGCHPGRIAICGVPLAWYPAAPLFGFVVVGLCCCLLGLTL